MTLEQLRILSAVVDQGGVIAASRTLNKTQPAVSNAISRLESALGVTLFDRSSYRLTLSDAGQVLYEQIRTILKQVDALEESAAYLSAGHEPEVSISLEVLTPVSCVSKIIGEVAADFPATRFSLTSDVMGGALEKLREGNIDIAIGPRIEALDGVESRLVTSVELIAVGASSRCRQVDDDRMSDLRQIVLRETTRQPSRRQFAVRADARKLYAADYIAKKQLLLDGAGWGFMPLHLVEREIADDQLIPLDFVQQNYRQIAIYAFRLMSGRPGPVATRIWDELGSGTSRST